MDLTTVRSRERLKPRREPYWHKLAVGRFLGFRPSSIGKNGHWIARFYDADTRRKPLKALGDFPNLPPNEHFGAAKKEAEAWFAHLDGGGSLESLTVRQACERYGQGRPDAEGRLRRLVYDDPIAKIYVAKLTKEHVRTWRKRLESTPALVSLKKSGKAKHRPRSPSTINRDMTVLRAALNLALDHGDALNDQAWRTVLRPIENADGRRNLYLDREQRRALLAALPDDARDFARGLCALPLRPGTLAALRAADFDPRRNELSIGKDKSGAARRILLPAATAALLREQIKSKTPAAPLFSRTGGNAWNRNAWKVPVKQAVRVAGLPDGVSAYTLRHSTITDLVTGGLDLLTVAQVSGTSVAMIEKHYGHLQRERAAQALATLTL